VVRNRLGFILGYPVQLGILNIPKCSVSKTARSLKSTPLEQAHVLDTSQILADSRSVLVPLGCVALNSPVSWSTLATRPAYRVFSQSYWNRVQRLTVNLISDLKCVQRLPQCFIGSMGFENTLGKAIADIEQCLA
jgi:hypothetical protein